MLSYHATCSKAEVDKFKVRTGTVALLAFELCLNVEPVPGLERLGVLRCGEVEGLNS